MVEGDDRGLVPAYENQYHENGDMKDKRFDRQNY